MEFVREKRIMLLMKSGKRQIMERIELQNQERIRTFGEKENYKYLRVLEVDREERKKKITKQYRDHIDHKTYRDHLDHSTVKISLNS